MIDDHDPPARQTITRTLTITTAETWSITIGVESSGAPEEGCLEARLKHSAMTIEQQELTQPESIHREEP